MDSETNNYYNNNADKLSIMYNSANPDYIKIFYKYMKPKCTILDIGSGSGRDINELLKSHLNFDPYGLEPSKSMVDKSIKIFPKLKNRVLLGSLPNNIPEKYTKIQWGCIITAAVFQHIPDSQLYDSLSKIYSLLKPSGILLISIPTEYPGISNNRDINGRLFILRELKEYIQKLEKINFTLKKVIEKPDALERSGIKWATLLLVKGN